MELRIEFSDNSISFKWGISIICCFIPFVWEMKMIEE